MALHVTLRSLVEQFTTTTTTLRIQKGTTGLTMNTECQETRSPQTDGEMGSPPQDPPPPARPRLTTESKVDLRKAEMEVQKLFLAEEERKTIELLKTTNLSMAAQQRAHHRRMTTVKPFNFRNIFNTSVAAENPTDVTREKELKERAERQGKAAILKADIEAAELFREEEKLKARKKRETNMENMKFNMSMVAEQRACRQQMKATEVPVKPFHLTNISRTTSAAEDPTRTAPQPKHSTSNTCWPRKLKFLDH